MNFHVNSRRLLPWVFVVLATTLGLNLLIVSREYWLLYSSLDQVGFSISRMTLQSPIGDMASILAIVKADNPVDYGGLTVTQVSMSAFFLSNGSSLFQEEPLGGGGATRQALASHTTETWTLTITLSPQDTTSLYSFYNAHLENITADSTLYVSVSSYLTILSGTPTLYEEQQNLTLS